MNLFFKIQRFMYGRNGLDALSKFLFKVLFWVLMFNILIHHIAMLYIELGLLLIILLRILSKNIKMRQKENNLYLRIKKRLLKPFEIIIKNHQDKDFVYKKCYKCKKILKLPLPDKRGIKHVKCPNCKKRLRVFTIKYQKIEIIRNK